MQRFFKINLYIILFIDKLFKNLLFVSQVLPFHCFKNGQNLNSDCSPAGE